MKNRKFVEFDNGLINIDRIIYVEKEVCTDCCEYFLNIYLDNDNDFEIPHESLEELEENYNKLKSFLLND